jgi:hypothetical protein
MKTLVDRYLREVGFFLPKPERQDILAELSEDIRTQVDEREAALSRPLEEPELEAILNAWGKPLVVAERYLPQRYLVGPVLYPIYMFVLKVVALVYLVPWVLVWAALMLFSPTYRGDDPWSRIGSLGTLWMAILQGFFFITIGFAYVERYKLTDWLGQDWRSHAPAKTDPNHISLASSILALIVNAAFASWWLKLGDMAHLWAAAPQNASVSLPAIWNTLYWPILLLFLIGIAFAIFALIRPRRSPAHAVLDLIRSAYALLLIVTLVCSSPLLEIHLVNPSPADVAHVENVERWFGISIRVTLAIIGIACAVDVFGNARRLVRRPLPTAAIVND